MTKNSYYFIVSIALLFFIFTMYGYNEIKNKLDSLTDIGINRNTPEKDKKEIPQLSIMPKGSNPFIGYDTAPVTMILHIDYQCGFCKQFIIETLPILEKEYVENGILQIVFKDFPLKSHKESNKIAIAAHYLFDEGQFDAFLSQVWDYRGGATDVFGFFGISNIDSKRQELYEQEIQKSLLLAKVAGITGTPTIIINNRMLKGLRTVEELKSLIDYSKDHVIMNENNGNSCN